MRLVNIGRSASFCLNIIFSLSASGMSSRAEYSRTFLVAPGVSAECLGRSERSLPKRADRRTGVTKATVSACLTALDRLQQPTPYNIEGSV